MPKDYPCPHCQQYHNQALKTHISSHHRFEDIFGAVPKTPERSVYTITPRSQTLDSKKDKLNRKLQPDFSFSILKQQQYFNCSRKTQGNLSLSKKDTKKVVQMSLSCHKIRMRASRQQFRKNLLQGGSPSNISKSEIQHRLLMSKQIVQHIHPTEIQLESRKQNRNYLNQEQSINSMQESVMRKPSMEKGLKGLSDKSKYPGKYKIATHNQHLSNHHTILSQVQKAIADKMAHRKQSQQTQKSRYQIAKPNGQYYYEQAYYNQSHLDNIKTTPQKKNKYIPLKGFTFKDKLNLPLQKKSPPQKSLQGTSICGDQSSFTDKKQCGKDNKETQVSVMVDPDSIQRPGVLLSDSLILRPENSRSKSKQKLKVYSKQKGLQCSIHRNEYCSLKDNRCLGFQLCDQGQLIFDKLHV